MRTSLGRFVATDGFGLFERTWPPDDGEVRAVVALLHFLAEVARDTASVNTRLGAVTFPLLALHGTDDKMADVTGSQELVAQAASGDKTLVLVAKGYHALSRDLCRSDVEQLVVDWLTARLPAD